MTNPPEIEQRSAYLDWKLWVPYLLLLGVGIPWYWSAEGKGMTMVWGLPLWVWSSLGAAFLASFYTAWLLLKYWPAESMEEEEPPHTLS